MDPNAALQSILHGHMVVEHVEALCDWMRNGGFAPDPQLRPVDVPPQLAALPYGVELTANMRGIVSTNGNVFFTWRQLERLAPQIDRNA